MPVSGAALSPHHVEAITQAAALCYIYHVTVLLVGEGNLSMRLLPSLFVLFFAISAGAAERRTTLVRKAWLKANVASARSRLDIIEGARFRFRDEATRLFALTPELRPLESYDPVPDRIEALLPGSGSLAERVETFRNRYVIPSNRLDAVMGVAIAECRRRTLAHIRLPP